MAVDPDETCWTVLHAAAAGDTGARSVFARTYERPVRAYLANRWRNHVARAELDDAVQEAFFECFKPRGALERADPGQGDFRALLYGVVRNVARRVEEKLARTGRQVPADSVHLDDLPAEAEALSRMFDRLWAQSLVREALRRQEAAAADGDGDAQRRFRVLQMRHDDGLTIRDIAAALGEANVASVHNDYRHARREFTRHLREVTATHTGAHGERLDAECRRLGELLAE